MNNTKKLALTVLAVVGLSGCASTQVSSMARPDAPPQARVAEPQVMRPMQSYGNLGGYRYRRFASASVAG